MKSSDEKRFQVIGHSIMVILSALAVIPIILLVISSFTDNDMLIKNGYSFLPEKWSFYAYEYIF